MNFEDAFKHYQEGTATEEEKEYVKEQLDQAKGFSELFDDEGINVKPAPIAAAEAAQLKRAKQEFKWRQLLIPLCCVAIAIIIAGAILGGVFGAASGYANSNIVYGRNASVEIATNYAYSLVSDPNSQYYFQYVTAPADFYVDDIDKKFVYDVDDIKQSYFVYRIELEIRMYDFSIEIDVDSRYPDKCTVHKFG